MARPRTVLAVAAAVVGALAAAAWWLTAGLGDGRDGAGSPLSLADSLGGGGAAGYERADRRRDFAFPADHGAHPGFRTEWWYFTGNLEAAGAGGGGRRFGFQLTFFRSAVAPPAAAAGERASAWATRQVWMAHLAVTDVAGERFHAAERFARGAVGLAGAEADPFAVWVRDWRAAQVAGGGGEGAGAGSGGRTDATFPWRLTAADGPVALDLRLAAGKGPVLQGDGGLSRKGEGAEASYYYSYPRLPARGTLTVGGERFAVAGDAWLDREWSSALLGEGRVGWDWFALQLGDGREVVAFRLRGAGEAGDGGLDYAALVAADGALRRLDAGAARLAVTDRWRSRQSGVRYPAGWRLRFPDAGLDLAVRPWIAGQELDLAVRYWEGAVRVEGAADGEPVGGVGYVELTGYGE